MTYNLLIRRGRVIDPASGRDEELDLLIQGDKISGMAKSIPEPEGAEIVDAAGKIVLPGLIDMHVHLREPGFGHKEDIDSGTKAAAAGGFTAVACMPNTEPAMDNDSVVYSVLRRASEKGHVRVYPVGAVTKGRAGKELAEMGEMLKAGAVAFSDDGSAVSTSHLMRCALEYLTAFGAPVIEHPEDKSLSEGGQMNLGLNSTIAGFRGIPREAEEIIVARDIALAGLTGGKLHLTHVSTAGSLELVRRAKARGLRVTCDVTPHHLLLTDDMVLESGYDTNTKVNPPLRSKEDVEAMKQGLIDGTIDAIATDHAPHHVDDKWVEYDYAEPGISGLETAVGLILDKLVRPGLISWSRMAEAMSLAPAKILGVPGGVLNEGAVADITIVDPEREFSVNTRDFKSKGKNTPFQGWRLTGMPWMTIVGGKIIMRNGTIVS
ncbi:MAG TPA: dihydroorotase [Firmicutes bacterium]|nr:dihydroorotase [Candidatus Fermentithermobacillaceae bacterium]